MDIEDATIGQRIAWFRKRFRGPDGERMSQGELADAVGVSTRAVGAWERDERQPTPKNVDAVADALGLDVSQLDPNRGRAGVVTSPDRADRGGEGHMVVRESGWVQYDPEYDPMASIAQEVDGMLSWLGEDLSRRLAGSGVTLKARLGQLYQIGLADGWTRERMDYIDAVRRRLQDIERSTNEGADDS